MWMINTILPCRQHLGGEHFEMHKHIPKFRNGHNVHGRFYPIIQIQFKGYKERHDALAAEMIRRGMNHNSPLIDIPDFKLIYPEYYDLEVDIEISTKELMLRCTECCDRILEYRRK